MLTVPQIVDKTGVSADYWNEYYGKVVGYDEIGGIHYAAELFLEFPVKPYQTRFPVDQYADVITPKNSTRITKPNELALVTNGFTDVSRFTEDDFKRLIHSVYELIYGEEFTLF